MKTPIQLRFNDIDQMGHVNNAVIMEFLDLGKSEYFTSVGLPPEEGDFTVMVVHVEVDFMSQILSTFSFFTDCLFLPLLHFEFLASRTLLGAEQPFNP